MAGDALFEIHFALLLLSLAPFRVIKSIEATHVDVFAYRAVQVGNLTRDTSSAR